MKVLLVALLFLCGCYLPEQNNNKIAEVNQDVKRVVNGY